VFQSILFKPASGESRPEPRWGRYDRSMRSRVPFFALLLVVGSFALPAAAHAAIPFFGPIIPDASNVCPASWGLLITVINNIISLLLTLAIVFLMPIMIAYAGFLFVVNPVNPAGREKAKGVLLHVVSGIVIALAAWMIVDALMAVLYNPATVGGTWSSLITSGGINPCLSQAGSAQGAGLNQVTGVSAGGGVVTTTTGLQQCSSSNTACSPAALQAAGLTATQAAVMSCIAVTESSGNPSTPPYNTTNPGSNSTACGTFQITQTTWNANATGACSSFSNCQNAACNIQVAATLVSKSLYSSWTCAGCNSKAAACITQYGP
jgi:hypothetical protein